MSQVVVTEDNLSSRRAKSRDQEHKIDRESRFKPWHRSHIAGKKDPVLVIVGLAVLPVVVFWGFLTAAMGVGLAMASAIFRFFAKIFR